MFNTDDLDEDALKNMEIMKKLGILSEDGEVIKHTFSISATMIPWSKVPYIYRIY